MHIKCKVLMLSTAPAKIRVAIGGIDSVVESRGLALGGSRMRTMLPFQSEIKVPLILRGLREPYLFKTKCGRASKRQQPQSRVSELSSRISDALVDVQDTAARTVLCEIRDEMMRLNESL